MATQGFADKFLHKISKIDPKEVENYVTRLLQEREVFHTVLSAFPDGILLVDSLQGILFSNDQICKIFSLSKEELATSPQEAYDNKTILAFLDLLAQNVTTQPEMHTVSLDTPERKTLSIAVVPVITQQKKPSSRLRLFIVRDITLGKIREIDSFDREMTHTFLLLAAGIAHEIGNPLNALDIHLQLLEWKIKKGTKGSPEKLMEHLTVARTEITRLDNIIRDFLKAIRPTPPHFKKTHINAICSKILEFLGKELKRKRIKVKTQYDQDIPHTFIDEIQMGQALINLLKNAIEAMPKGGIIYLSTQRKAGDIHILIRDTGTGIDQSTIDNVFEPYFTTKQTGSGLGLAIVKRIIRSHGGRIAIRNVSEEHGAEVNIAIPIREKQVKLLPE